MTPLYRRRLRRSTAKLWKRTESSRTEAARYLCAVLPQPQQRHSLSRSSSYRRRMTRGYALRFRATRVRALNEKAAEKPHSSGRGRGRGKQREQRADEAEQSAEGGQPPASSRSTKPRGRANDYRAEGGRREGKPRKRSKPGPRVGAPRGRPTDRHAPPAASRRAEDGADCAAPPQCATRRRYNTSARATRINRVAGRLAYAARQGEHGGGY